MTNTLTPSATVKFYDMPDGMVETEVDMHGGYTGTHAQKIALRCAFVFPEKTGLKIIYRHNKPYGIRDESGFLLFFTDISKYQGQEERYRTEVEEQYKLADYLLLLLQNR